MKHAIGGMATAMPMVAPTDSADVRGGMTAFAVVMPWILAAVERSRTLTLTVKSRLSGDHLTYQLRPVKLPPNDRSRARAVMVDVLTGPNNGADYTFLGMVRFEASGVISVLTGGRTQRADGSHGSTISNDARTAKVLHWLFERLAHGRDLNPTAEVWHDGTCARCGRPLTTPESVALGLGPICAGRVD